MPRTIDQARANLEASIPMIATRYIQGVNGADWQGPASSDNAEALWAANVAKAAQEKRRQRGIMNVSNETWRAASRTKGAAAIGPGIQAGLAKYVQNFGPVLQAINSAVASLPPRTSDPMQNLTARAGAVIKAAVAAKRK